MVELRFIKTFLKQESAMRETIQGKLSVTTETSGHTFSIWPARTVSKGDHLAELNALL